MKKDLAALIFFFALFLIFTTAVPAQSKDGSNNKKTGDRKLKILNKPRAKSPECSQTKGQTIVRATFDKSAKVTYAVITKSSGCDNFDNSVLDAVRQIEFEPEVRNGEAVTVTKPVEYR